MSQSYGERVLSALGSESMTTRELAQRIGGRFRTVEMTVYRMAKIGVIVAAGTKKTGHRFAFVWRPAGSYRGTA